MSLFKNLIDVIDFDDKHLKESLVKLTKFVGNKFCTGYVGGPTFEIKFIRSGTYTAAFICMTDEIYRESFRCDIILLNDITKRLIKIIGCSTSGEFMKSDNIFIQELIYSSDLPIRFPFSFELEERFECLFRTKIINIFKLEDDIELSLNDLIGDRSFRVKSARK